VRRRTKYEGEKFRKKERNIENEEGGM